MNASLTEGAFEQSKFHLACVDGRHGRVAKSTNTQRGLQLHLSTSLSPHPADKRESGLLVTVVVSHTNTNPCLASHTYPHIFFLYLSAILIITSR